MKVRATGNTANTTEKPPTRKFIAMKTIRIAQQGMENVYFMPNCDFLPFTTDSDNILNGNTPPIASQKAFNIIADSLRRIDVSAI